MTTNERKKQAQHIHDAAAAFGAVCRGSNTSGAPDPHSRFLQSVHDAALGSGADCSLWREGSPLATFEPGKHYATGGPDMRPAYGSFQPGNYAAMAADDAAFAEALDNAVARGEMTRQKAAELAEARQLAEAYAARRNREGAHPPSGEPPFTV